MNCAAFLYIRVPQLNKIVHFFFSLSLSFQARKKFATEKRKWNEDLMQKFFSSFPINNFFAHSNSLNDLMRARIEIVTLRVDILVEQSKSSMLFTFHWICRPSSVLFLLPRVNLVRLIRLLSNKWSFHFEWL